MKTALKLPTEINKNLKLLYPYRKEMRSLILENGYTVPKEFDALVYKYFLIFQGKFNDPEIDHGFFSDIWDGVKTFGNQFSNLITSVGGAASGIIATAMGGAAQLRGGGGAATPAPKKDNTMLYILLIAGAALLFFTLKKK